MKKQKNFISESSKLIRCAGLHVRDVEHMSRPPRNLILVLGYKIYPKTRFYQHRNRPRFRRIRPRFRESDVGFGETEVGFDRNRGRIRETDVGFAKPRSDSIETEVGFELAGAKPTHRKTKRCELLMDRISVSQWS